MFQVTLRSLPTFSFHSPKSLLCIIWWKSDSTSANIVSHISDLKKNVGRVKPKKNIIYVHRWTWAVKKKPGRLLYHHLDYLHRVTCQAQQDVMLDFEELSFKICPYQDLLFVKTWHWVQYLKHSLSLSSFSILTPDFILHNRFWQ